MSQKAVKYVPARSKRYSSEPKKMSKRAVKDVPVSCKRFPSDQQKIRYSIPKIVNTCPVDLYIYDVDAYGEIQRIIIIIIIIIIKTSSTGPSGKNKIVYKLLSQPHKHLRHRKLKRHYSGKLPTVDCTLEQILRSGVKHSVGKVFPHSNLRGQEKPNKFGRSTST